MIQIVTNVLSGGELAQFLLCTFLVTLWPILFQMVGWPGFIVLSSGNTYFGASFLGGELLCFSHEVLLSHIISLYFS